MPEDAKAVVERWFEEVWNKGREDAIDELLSTECSVLGLGPEICCPGEFKEYHKAMLASIGEIDFTLDKVNTSDGGKVSGIMDIKARHKASDVPFRIQGAFTIIVRDGKIACAHNVVDFIPMLIAIGALKKNALKEAFTASE